MRPDQLARPPLAGELRGGQQQPPADPAPPGQNAVAMGIGRVVQDGAGDQLRVVQQQLEGDRRAEAMAEQDPRRVEVDQEAGQQVGEVAQRAHPRVARQAVEAGQGRRVEVDLRREERRQPGELESSAAIPMKGHESGFDARHPGHTNTRATPAKLPLKLRSDVGPGLFIRAISAISPGSAFVS